MHIHQQSLTLHLRCLGAPRFPRSLSRASPSYKFDPQYKTTDAGALSRELT